MNVFCFFFFFNLPGKSSDGHCYKGIANSCQAQLCSTWARHIFSSITRKCLIHAKWITEVLALAKRAGLVPTNPTVQGLPGAKATCPFCHNFSSNGAQGAPPWTRIAFVPGEAIQKLIQAFPQALLTKVEIQTQYKDLCIQTNCESHGMLSELYINLFSSEALKDCP